MTPAVLQNQLRELHEMCRMVVADGLVHRKEASLLQEWLRAHPQIVELWPAQPLFRILQAAHQEASSPATSTVAAPLAEPITAPSLLHRCLLLLQGDHPAASTEADIEAARQALLPLDAPPSLAIAGQRFALLGEAHYGPTNALREAILQRGGHFDETIRPNLDCLIVGSFHGQQWYVGEHGDKIRQVLQLKAIRHRPLWLIDHPRWETFLAASPPPADPQAASPLEEIERANEVETLLALARNIDLDCSLDEVLAILTSNSPEETRPETTHPDTQTAVPMNVPINARIAAHFGDLRSMLDATPSDWQGLTAHAPQESSTRQASQKPSPEKLSSAKVQQVKRQVELHATELRRLLEAKAEKTS